MNYFWGEVKIFKDFEENVKVTTIAVSTMKNCHILMSNLYANFKIDL